MATTGVQFQLTIPDDPDHLDPESADNPDDQANIDLLDVVDSTGTKFIVVHIIDYATSFQLAELLPKKQLAM